MPLDTLANVKLTLGVTGTADDALLDVLRANAEGFILAHCGRDFVGGSYTEDHPGGGRLLFLKNFPVASVTDVRVDVNRGFGTETIIDAAGYVVHADRGVIESVKGRFVRPRPGCRPRSDDFPGAVRVAYTTPTDQVPAAIKAAYADLVGFWLRQTKTNAALGQQLITSQYVDGAQLAYTWELSKGLDVPPAILRTLAPFRAPGM